MIALDVPVTLTGNYEYERYGRSPKDFNSLGGWYRAEVILPDGRKQWYWHDELRIFEK
jgi:hypothetical protein